jgi:hypothetical protein
MNNSPKFYYDTQSDVSKGRGHADAWEICLQTFDNKEYLKCFHSVLDYANPRIRKLYGNAAGTHFNIPHGSTIMNVSIENDEFKIASPFLDISTANVVPLLRQICTINQDELLLESIYIHDNQLNFEYSCKLSETEPYKIYYMLRGICRTGNKFGYEYVTKFGAKRVSEPVVKPLPADKLEKIYNDIVTMVNAALENINYFESRRWYNSAWDLAATVLRQIDLYARPRGQFMYELEDAVDEMQDREMTVTDKIVSAKAFLKNIVDGDKSRILNSLYEVEIFMPEKKWVVLENMQAHLDEPYKRMQEGYGVGNHMAVTLDVLYNFHNMLYLYLVPEDIGKHILNALKKSSEKPWEQASPILFSAIRDLMQGKIPQVKKGFMSRIINLLQSK